MFQRVFTLINRCQIFQFDENESSSDEDGKKNKKKRKRKQKQAKRGSAKKKANAKALLKKTKTLPQILLETDALRMQNNEQGADYVSAEAAPSKAPARRFCAVTGYLSR